MSPSPLVEDAAAQLHRLLLAIPTLADDQPHRIADVAAQVGTTAETLARDLRTLVTRFDDGAPGFIEGVQLFLDAETVQLQSQLFRRPMGLTRSELRALELGLAMLQRDVPPDERSTLDSARARVRHVAMAAPSADEPVTREGTLVTTLTGTIPRDRLRALRTAIRTRRQLQLGYQSAQAASPSERVVHPMGLVCARGRWFLIAQREEDDGLRVYRVDRMTSVATLAAPAAPAAAGFSLDQVLDQGRVLVSDATETLTVRYSAAIARWIAEREGGTVAPDGTLVVEHPLTDDHWAVRHVLQYGPDAEVLSPPRIRAMLRERLAAMGGVP